MLEFITNSDYRNPTKLVQFQDSIINKSSINLQEADEYLNELEKYSIIFKSFLGFNQVPNSNISIRQNIIISTLYYIKNDHVKCTEHKTLADSILLSLKKHWMYMEGYSYYLYVRDAYRFHYRFVPIHFAGFIDPETLSMMEKMYAKFASPDNKLPFTDTSKTHELLNEERLTVINEMYSVHYLNNQRVYIFINHNKYINEYSKNLHVNFEFGHVVVFNEGWKLLHPHYPGYAKKQSTPIKESYNNNIIYGNHCKESLWRYMPNKPSLEWTYKDNVYNLKIGKNITRKIEILNNGLIISDSGGDYSSFNISDDCDSNFSGSKIVNTKGYHSPDYGEVQSHKRVELYGNHRLFYMGF